MFIPLTTSIHSRKEVHQLEAQSFDRREDSGDLLNRARGEPDAFIPHFVK